MICCVLGLYFTSWNECSSFILTLDKSVRIVSDYSSAFNIKRPQIDIDKVMCSNHSHLDTGCDVPGVTKGISTTTVLPDTDREIILSRIQVDFCTEQGLWILFMLF